MKKLYYKESCSYSLKVLEVINNNKLDVELYEVDESLESYSQLILGGGKPTVPCLHDENGWLYESKLIIEYLNRKSILLNHGFCKFTNEDVQFIKDNIDDLSRSSCLNSILVMASYRGKMHVFLSNDNKNYNAGDSSEKSNKDNKNKPLYCEKVVNSGKSLYVSNASIDPEWAENEDLKLFGLGVYLGFPIKVNDKVIGTLCSLHDQPFDFKKGSPSVYERMNCLKDKIENLLL
ncbi:hypothetical protein CWN98_09095 [Vibrio splendidus]|uniref:glutathione S-transferase N-terminal domain-containing protein n=1 Tax=Vibrio splendidus TaxID=29497 RepID=UPI000D36CB24|nr:glutathione S-transferase N-terminal domain-containing protein [Vibrio splendidus]PTO87919.1 hypothetical protein CWN98_09095 [Vibrio splendidus]PTP46751.1 hypothetical protein CWO10_14785 [Vibrio splendidus]